MPENKKTRKNTNKSKKIIRKSFSFLFSFLAMFTAFIFCVLIIAKVTAFNKNFFKKAVDKTDYTIKLTERIKEKMISDTRELSGGQIPDEALDEIFMLAVAKGTVRGDTLKSLDAALNNAPSKVNTRDLSSNLHKGFNKYIAENHPDTPVEGELKENIEQLIKNCEKIYKAEVEVEYIDKYGKVLTSFSFVLDIAVIVTGILALLLILPVIPLNYRAKTRFQYAIFASSGLMLMLLVLPAVIYGFKFIDRIVITGLLRILFEYMAFKTVNMFIYAGLAAAALTVLLTGLRLIFVRLGKVKELKKNYLG